MSRMSFLFLLLLALGAGHCWRSLCAADAEWEAWLEKIDPQKEAVAGSWSRNSDGLKVNALSGARLALPAPAHEEYDLQVTFTRQRGQHSIGIVVPSQVGTTVFEVDAWGMHLAGFQNVDGQSIRENSTRKTGMALENNRKYTMTVEVRKNQLRGLLDGKEVSKLSLEGHQLTVPDLWAMPDSSRLGLLAWEAETLFHSIEYRPASGSPTVAKSSKKTAPVEKSGTKKSTTPSPKTAKTSPATTTPTPARTTNNSRKRVLIVIANQDFFYREYGEPRQELERAGFQVVVAAGRKAPCRPHNNSGEGPDGGVVTPDVTLAEVKAADYEAILFSGGWGSSMYQYAFNGSYSNPVYNGDRNTKSEVNRVINEFIAADKYVCALCNAVSVLAWARVNGRSPLQGKRVCAPTRQAAAGIYNGRPAQPSCRWHPEANGAIMSPPGAVGMPNTNVDDVLVDGKIITGEDDPSAREMGRRIVQVLSE